MADLTDDQILTVLTRMEQEQNFFDQMRVAWKSTRAVITRYKEIQVGMPALVTEEERLKESINTIEADIASRLERGKKRVTEEHTELQASLREQIEPLQIALDEAKSRIKRAEKAAILAEQDSVGRVEVATTAAVLAEERQAKAESALADIRARVGAL